MCIGLARDLIKHQHLFKRLVIDWIFLRFYECGTQTSVTSSQILTLDNRVPKKLSMFSCLLIDLLLLNVYLVFSFGLLQENISREILWTANLWAAKMQRWSKLALGSRHTWKLCCRCYDTGYRNRIKKEMFNLKDLDQNNFHQYLQVSKLKVSIWH